MVLNSEQIKTQITEFIKDSKNRLTPLAVEKHFLSNHSGVSKKIFYQSLKELIANGTLAYTYEFGSSFLEISFDKAVRVSDHVVLKPEGQSFTDSKNDIVITLQKGASFGSGRHPSTRLALKAMESILLPKRDMKNREDQTALDIGTGTGILAITAAQMGIGKIVGLDTDPCARSEAMQNIYLNGLTNRVMIDNRSFESIDETFFIILANLRFPTLCDMQEHMSDILERRGFAILSGLKTEEIDPLEKLYKKQKMTYVRTFTEKDWASIVLQKTD